MKKIEAIVRPERLDAVREALENCGCDGMMVSEIEGHGKQKGVVQQWRGEKYKLSLLPKIKLEMIVRDADEAKIIATLLASAKTGDIGDGKIFVSDVGNVIRIRTGERGEAAV